MKNVKDFWEKCDETFAHLEANEWLHNNDALTNSFKRHLWKIDPTDKVIVDYGTGAGYFGRYLFKNHNISKYIGIDIAERSIKSAKEALAGHNAEFKLTPVDFSKLNADIFASFAIIQHFPDVEYLNSFLKNLNDSGISEIILQIRYNKETKFSNKYDTIKDVRLSCVTNPSYLMDHLSNYECIHEGDVSDDNDYQYVYFKIKK